MADYKNSRTVIRVHFILLDGRKKKQECICNSYKNTLQQI